MFLSHVTRAKPVLLCTCCICCFVMQNDFGYYVRFECDFIALWSTEMTWAIWLAVSKLWEFTFSWKKLKYTYELRITFFSLLRRKIIIIKEIKYVLRASIACWKPRLRLGFSLICSGILPNVCLGFHQAMKARRTYFIS